MQKNLLIARDKLTRSFFVNLPAGVYLTSNVYLTRTRPIYESYVASETDREEQWSEIPRIVRHRVCNVFRCKADFDAWLINSILGGDTQSRAN